jgi:uncharacterized protein YodC (DUF2158 family)
MAVIELPKPPEASGPFVIGSTVKLKGGGAVMTVQQPGRKAVVVEWHNSSDDPISAAYHPDMLRHAHPDDEVKKAPDGGG